MKTRFPAVRLIGQLFFLFLVAVLLSPSVVMAADSNFSEPKSTPATESGTPTKADQNPVDWVNRVGREISVSCPVEVILSREINAWVTEDRTIHITTGILELCQSDDEVAGILAHEYGHLQLGHFEEARKRQAGFNQVMEAYRHSMGSENSGTLEGSGKVAAAIMVVRFGHESEFAADKFAYSLLSKGKNPMALSDLFDRIAKGKIDSKLLSWLLSDHPAFSDRIERFESYQKERLAYERFASNCLHVKPDAYSQVIALNPTPDYHVELLQAGKRMSYYLLLPSGMTYRKGVLQIVAGLPLIILVRKNTEDNWQEIGIRTGNLRVYTTNNENVGDYVIMLNPVAFTSQIDRIEIYCNWFERTRKGEKKAGDVIKIKILLPNPASLSQPPSPPKPGEVIGPLCPDSPYAPG